MNNRDSQLSFVVGSNQYFNSVTSKFSSVSEHVASLGAGDGLVVRNAAGVDVAKFTDSSVSTKGTAVYEGAQAGCSPDGVYCRSAAVEDTRNYFCDLTAPNAGICTYSLLSSRSCNTLDYYYCSGSTQYRRQLHSCADSHGGCYPSSTVLIQTCSVPATSYGSWSCYSQTSRVRTNIVYSPTCSSAGGCGVSSATVQDIQSCPSGNYCNGGSCYSYVYTWRTDSWSSCSAVCDGGTQTRDVYCEQSSGGLYPPSRVADFYCGGGKPATSQSCNTAACTYSWRTGSWSSCSVSCGGGTRTRAVDCVRDVDSQIVSDSYCSGTKPSESDSCNTQACCTSHSGVGCYNGDVWWWDSCGHIEELKSSCSSSCSCTDYEVDSSFWIGYSKAPSCDCSCDSITGTTCHRS